MEEDLRDVLGSGTMPVTNSSTHQTRDRGIGILPAHEHDLSHILRAIAAAA